MSGVLVGPVVFELERLKKEIMSAVVLHNGQMGKLTVLAGQSGKAFVINLENNLEIADEMCDIVSKSKIVDKNSVAGEDLPAYYNWDSGNFTKPTSIVSFAIK